MHVTCVCARAAAAVAAATRPTLQQRHRIVVPTLPSSHSNSSNNSDEDAHHMPSPHLASFLDDGDADVLRRQLQLRHFHDEAERSVDALWRDTRSHLRRQARLVHELGVDGAVRETLQPSRPSFAAELQQRPLDRAILEEIYTGLHGRRVERKLKKGVRWEHWMARGEGTAPVYTASTSAHCTFAFGGHVTLVRAAAHARQFPVVARNGAVRSNSSIRSIRSGRGNDNTPTQKRRQGTDAATATTTPVETSLLLPEVAFIGRTSCGKSSLVNALVNAMVSPYGELHGTTNTVRFYAVANRLLLVDCPGYGYYNPMATPALDAQNAVHTMRSYLHACAAAAAPLRTRRGRRDSATTATMTGTGQQHGDSSNSSNSADSADDAGAEVTRSARRGRRHDHVPRHVKRVMVCVCASGIQPLDLQYCDLLEHLAVPFSVVMTKTDLVPVRKLARIVDYTRSRLVHYRHCKEMMLSSALRLAGIDKLQTLIGSFVTRTDDALHGATDNFDSIV